MGTATAGAEMDLVAWRRKRQFFFCVQVLGKIFEHEDNPLAECQKNIACLFRV
jgi:hypothetical protein